MFDFLLIDIFIVSSGIIKMLVYCRMLWHFSFTGVLKSVNIRLISVDCSIFRVICAEILINFDQNTMRLLNNNLIGFKFQSQKILLNCLNQPIWLTISLNVLKIQ